MRPALLNAYLAMLPRLQAEELLMQRAVLVSANGYQMKKHDADGFVKNLQKVAHAITGKRIRTLDDLRATGIPIVHTRKKVTPDG